MLNVVQYDNYDDRTYKLCECIIIHVDVKFNIITMIS